MEFHYEFTGPAGEELAGIFGALYAGMLLVFLLIGLALLVVRSFGLYVMAKRRGLRRPWLVWIPVAESWIIGSISDQYRYLVKGEYQSRRKILLGLAAANALLSISALIIVAATVGVVLPQAGNMSDGEMAEVLLSPVLAVLILSGVLGVLQLAQYVLRQMCMYDLYCSCDPGSAVLYLVLGILVSFLEPVFVVANRKKEEGMPPRRIPVDS